MGEEEHEDKPLWLPKGSVRAIMALATIATACYMAMFSAQLLPDWLVGLIGTIVGFYFGTRAASS